ncbi:MAG: MarR family transcriptional regulator [Pseudorhodoplanes sp.]
MRPSHPHRDLAFLINDVGRMLRTYADQEVRRFGMTRAQWAVLKRLELNQGLKQSELAEMLDLQPITLTRLVDRLCDSGLIERRADPNDRRAKRLFLTAEAQPLMDRLDALGHGLMQSILHGVPDDQTDAALTYLGKLKDNLRRLLSERTETEDEKEQQYA